MRLKIAKAEINLLRNLPPCDNIIKFYDSSIEQNSEGMTVALMLIEFCKEGSLFNVIEAYDQQKKTLTEQQIINIVKQIANGLKIMHHSNPPMAHQDVKIENVLLNDKKCKLCDFGSCSSTTYDFSKINSYDFDKYEELFEKTTTLMYRPPEMCDLYKGYFVNTKIDIWMLGCVVYVLCFFKHPFCESSKFAIIDANYQFPPESKYSEKMHDFIRVMLTPNPKLRPSIDDIIKITSTYFNVQTIELNSEASKIKQKQQEQKQFDSQIDQQQLSNHFDGDIPLEVLQRAQQKIIKGKKDTKQNKNEMQFTSLEDVGKQSETKVQIKQQQQQQQQNFGFGFEFNQQQVKQQQPIAQQNIDWFGSFQQKPQQGNQQQFQKQTPNTINNSDPFSFQSFSNQQFQNSSQQQKQVNFDSFGVQPQQQQKQQLNNNLQSVFAAYNTQPFNEIKPQQQQQKLQQQQQKQVKPLQQQQQSAQQNTNDLIELNTIDKGKGIINDLNQIDFSLI